MRRTCAECGNVFEAKAPHAEFCSPSCRMAMNNRAMSRGKMLLDLYVHQRFNREEALAKGVKTILDRMVANWVNEDREAGRRVMRPLSDCLEAAVEHQAVINRVRAGR